MCWKNLEQAYIIKVQCFISHGDCDYLDIHVMTGRLRFNILQAIGNQFLIDKCENCKGVCAFSVNKNQATQRCLWFFLNVVLSALKHGRNRQHQPSNVLCFSFFLFFKHLFEQILGDFALVVQGVLDRPALQEKLISNYVSCYNPGILLMSMCRQRNLQRCSR